MRKLYAISRAWGLTALLGLAGATAAYAQIGYSASSTEVSSGTYTDLGTTGTAITTTSKDNANSAAQAIGFSFHYNGADFTQFVLNTNGLVRLGAVAPSSVRMFARTEAAQPATAVNPITSTAAADVNLLLPFNYDLTGGSTAEYRVVTTGNAPDRVCTVQWKNVYDKAATLSAQYATMSFQLKLYETSNRIEFVYAAATPGTAGSEGTRGAFVGIKGSGYTDSQIVALSKDVDADWSAAEATAGNFFFLFERSVTPAAGQTYAFVLPSCFAPTKLALSAITETTASLSFTGPANAAGYYVLYGPTGFTDIAQGTVVQAATSPITITGLTSGTGYDVYVQTDCGNMDASSISAGTSFMTTCSADQSVIATFPYAEGFDTTIPGGLPCGYKIVDSNNDGSTWSVGNLTDTNATNSAPHSIYYSYNSNNAANDWIFTAPVAVKAGHTYQLQFAYTAYDATYPEGLEVKYGTAATAAGMTSTLFSNKNITTEDFVTTTTKDVPSITPTADGTIYIGFHAISAADQYYLLVDDINLTDSAPLPVKNAANTVFRADASPVPFGSYLHLSLNTRQPGAVRLTLRDALGRTVREASSTVSVGAATLSVPEVATLPTGVYFLEVEQAGLRQVLRVSHE